MIDLDGVVWLAGSAIGGSAEAIEALRSHGKLVAFVTNNSGPTVLQVVSKLEAVGVSAAPNDIVTSSQAAASMLEPGSIAHAMGGPGIREALGERGVRIASGDDEVSAVVVGRSEEIGYRDMARTSSLIRGGARFIATNEDATYPTGNGLEPGAGAVIAYLEVASGKCAEVAGKPHQPMAALVRDRFPDVQMVVGDRQDTDGLFASRIGVPFSLVLSGVSKAVDRAVDPAPQMVAKDLAEVAARYD